MCTLQARTRNQDEDQSTSDSSLGRISRCGLVHGTLKIGDTPIRAGGECGALRIDRIEQTHSDDLDAGQEGVQRYESPLVTHYKHNELTHPCLSVHAQNVG
jgi:hypothetical protein